MNGVAPYLSSSSSSSLKILKRKEVDEVSDDFSDFSLSAPARKTRRLVLDAELPTIIEEEEGSMMPGEFGEEEGDSGLISNEQRKNQELQIEELVMPESSSATSDNEERAIVLFKPVNNLHLLHRSPNNFSVSLDSNIISGFRNQFLWSSQSGGVRSVEEEEAGARRDNSMAVVPWVPSQTQPAFLQEIIYSNNASVPQTELMDSEEMGEAAMDIEEDNNDQNYSGSEGLGQAQENQAFGFGGIRAGSDGLPQWQQQHCLVPQIPQNPNPTPVTWLP
ncbi:PREDICTED: uncharacterized protein LOC105120987 [Populus euphratica]|uniref:Uncharacterized protein LOC105120987 n=1 Tax=Populus euphratica TaxID=75702 RepID=A0AAJ6TUS5_POPEU|nr:PREDICTED: uncharacterized protein LOC105120987 [Populus euphratica]XP_011017744.1 PREDICTED: uncharacterized protein LOC105120987 [Populus euphratica]